MIPLFTQEEFDSAKSRQKLPLKCKHCGETFHRSKNEIQKANKSPKAHPTDFCNNPCRDAQQITKQYVFCDQCGKPVSKILSQVKKFKHHFCSSSCAAKFHNAHKQTGTRRSKLEVWLAKRLVALHPDLELHFNRTDAIDAELDIYIPALRLAFELNGLFHYEPVFGQGKLDRIKSNDERKFAACAEKGIGLCVLDVSKISYFKERTAQPFLDIVERIISQAISPEKFPGLTSGAA